MINVANIEALKNLENLSRVNQREVYCPMANLRAMTTPLVAADDLLLKTTISAVDTYDYELTRLLYNHTSFIEIERQLELKEFITMLSYIDRQLLLWGVFTSTYNTLGVQDIVCDKCNHEFKDEVLGEELIQDDTMLPWDQEVAFNEYTFPIEQIVDIENIYKLEFDTSIPTIKQHLDVLGLISSEKLRSNFEKFNSILSRTEELASVVRSIKVYRTKEHTDPDVFSSPRDVHVVIDRYLLLSIVDDVLEKYNEHFSKYVPVFKKPYTCPKCGHDFDYVTDMEVSLFRRFLRG
jgi:hypothetical protein